MFVSMLLLLVAVVPYAVRSQPVNETRREILFDILPVAAHKEEHRWQPLTDFAKDSCYYTAAIATNGRVNVGGSSFDHYETNCRDEGELRWNNVYSRRRCNNGWCAIMYEYYFEKDVIWIHAAGHVHEWENIVVFVKDDKVHRVAPSCHGKYKHAANAPDFLTNEAGVPKAVYHSDGMRTHCWRLAKKKDRGNKNYYGHWFIGNLVGWGGWPQKGIDLKRKLRLAFPQPIGPKLWDDDRTFAHALTAAADGQVPGFNPLIDDWSYYDRRDEDSYRHEGYNTTATKAE